MIYECPQCQAPQAAGQTICPHCNAEFDGPVPDDAITPALAEAAPAETTPATPPAADRKPAEDEAAAAVPDPGPMPLGPPSRKDSAGPPVSSTPPPVSASPPPISSGSQPYLTPPTYAPPPYTPPATSAPYTPQSPPLGKLTRVLLIAFPIVLILVLAGVYFANTLNTDTDSVPAPAISTPVETAAPPPPTPVGDPMLLQGGTNTNNGSDPRVRLLAGRWVSKADTFYVFNPDGTGSRGSTANPANEQSFLWGLVQNRLMLYGSKNETLRFNTGPDNDTVFLGPQTGSYVQYSRTKTQ